MSTFNDLLRQEIKASSIIYNSIRGIQNFSKHSSAIIYGNIEDNFLQSSIAAIKINGNWSSRTQKQHSHLSSGYKEMQSSNSSDALLMNIFCHPKIGSWKGIQNLLKIPAFTINQIEFGYNPIILVDGTPEKRPTEVDLFIHDQIICEAKLTEKDFTSKSKSHVNKYDLFSKIFDVNSLAQTDKEYLNYQLIRNIIAAVDEDRRFILLCDMRRPDLIAAFHHTTGCILDIQNRMRCEFITWQQISTYVGKDLRDFLKLKYGI